MHVCKAVYSVLICTNKVKEVLSNLILYMNIYVSRQIYMYIYAIEQLRGANYAALEVFA